MKRYMSGIVTGALVGSVMTGVWLLNRPRPSLARLAIRSARRVGPKAFRVAKTSGRLVHMAKRRLG